ncbi:MAG: hypothetical protein ACI89W_000262 [Gammaproteobacteria bacterium]|jgi:hypothetical protein
MNFYKVKLMVVVFSLTTANVATAGNSRTYVANDDSIESKICVAAATGSKLHLNSKVKDLSTTKLMTTKYQIVANNLNCNGINIVDFAEMAGNIQIANKLKSYRIENVEIRDIAAIYNGNVAISDSY